MFSRFILTLTLACCCGASVLAQDASSAPAKVVVPDALADELKEYSDLFNRGFYDELIFKANRKIAEMGATPDIPSLYFRGWAYYRLRWFPLAEADLNAVRSAGFYAPSKEYASVMNALNSIKRYKKVMPPKMQEIRQGERLLFRMHYFGMEGGTVTVQGLLPNAYRINREMFGTDVEATTVYVFDTYEQFSAYYKAASGDKKLGSWIWALTKGDVVLICLQNPESESVSLKNRDSFVSIIVHEVNHALSNRLMGWSSQPNWFKEGLAQAAQAQASESFVSRTQKTLKRLFANDALVPIEKLSNYESFAEQVELGIVMGKGDDSQLAPNPYAQGYGMAKHLLDNTSTPQLQSFLNRVRDSDDFNAAFAEEFGMTVEQFYEAWKRDYAQKLAAQ